MAIRSWNEKCAFFIPWPLLKVNVWTCTSSIITQFYTNFLFLQDSSLSANGLMVYSPSDGAISTTSPPVRSSLRSGSSTPSRNRVTLSPGKYSLLLFPRFISFTLRAKKATGPAAPGSPLKYFVNITRFNFRKLWFCQLQCFICTHFCYSFR